MHVVFLPPNQGGWPLWDSRIRELLAECEALGNIDVLRDDNIDIIECYKEEHSTEAKLLSGAFMAKRAEVSR